MRRVRVKGSGGHIVADLDDEEIGRARLAGELFIGALGRVDEGRILSYYCNSCSREVEGSPVIKADDPGEEVAEGHLLVEQGEYLCRDCGGVIARYKVFNRASRSPSANTAATASTADAANVATIATGGYSAYPPGHRHSGAKGRAERIRYEGREGLSLKSLLENDTVVLYRASRIGVLRDIILIDGRISLLIARDRGDGEEGDEDDDVLLLSWESVEGIRYGAITVRGKICSRCRYENSVLDAYCTECGNRLG